RRNRRAGRPIGCDLGAVAHHVVADDVDVIDVVAGEGAHAGRPDRRARKGARLHLHRAFGGDDAAGLGGTELDVDVAARRRTGGAEYLLARHHHLHRLAGLLRQADGDRLEVDDGLATEAAADFGRGDTDLRRLEVEQAAAETAHLEVSLRRRP